VAATLVQHLATAGGVSAVARVFLRPGKGQIMIGKRPFEEYFPTEATRTLVRQPLLATETADKFDVLILTKRGRLKGQAGAAGSALPGRWPSPIPSCGRSSGAGGS